MLKIKNWGGKTTDFIRKYNNKGTPGKNKPATFSGMMENKVLSLQRTKNHYRLTQDEWNVVSGKFKITGIPHYTLVGKDGRIINRHLMYMSPENLKNMLMKYAKE